MSRNDSVQQRALIIDDDDVFRTQLSRALARRQWSIQQAAEGSEAIRLARECVPDLAIVDLRLPGLGGLEIVERLRRISDSTTIIVLTGYGSIATALSAVRLGADDFLTKPADADQIMAAYEKIESDTSPLQQIGLEPSVPTLGRVEWEHIQRVLGDCNGNVSHAARLLGVHRRSLQRKLSKYPPRG
jgi:two-component system response regulator RegA